MKNQSELRGIQVEWLCMEILFRTHAITPLPHLFWAKHWQIFLLQALEKIERPSKKRRAFRMMLSRERRTLMIKLQTEEGKPQSGPWRLKLCPFRIRRLKLKAITEEWKSHYYVWRSGAKCLYSFFYFWFTCFCNRQWRDKRSGKTAHKRAYLYSSS